MHSQIITDIENREFFIRSIFDRKLGQFFIMRNPDFIIMMVKMPRNISFWVANSSILAEFDQKLPIKCFKNCPLVNLSQ